MSADWVNDINRMQTKYGVREWIKHATPFELKKYLEFRLNFIKEEYDETCKALSEEDSEEIVDGLIDLCVVAIGTLDALGVNVHKAWNEVYEANMNKEVGVKESRPNPLGLPDLIKPEGWTAPSHEKNHGIIGNAWSDEITKKAMEANAARTELIADNPDVNSNWAPDAISRIDIIGQNGNDGLHYTPGPGPLDGTQAKINWEKDSEYIRLYGTPEDPKI
tara:strand:- start:477 stop:1136 length:660 start_codon:yes stop_codon:yes gene_type:complete